jgi:hypothetical protein
MSTQIDLIDVLLYEALCVNSNMSVEEFEQELVEIKKNYAQKGT